MNRVNELVPWNNHGNSHDGDNNDEDDITGSALDVFHLVSFSLILSMSVHAVASNIKRETSEIFA